MPSIMLQVKAQHFTAEHPFTTIIICCETML